MIISEKLDLLMLGKDERAKASTKFLTTLALINKEELQEELNFLRNEGVHITKAKDIKVLGNTKEEIAKKFSILREIHETDIYKQDPSKINYNVIDIYKKIQYCKQIGRPYKKEDGAYEAFLFNEGLWQQVANKEINKENFTQVEEEIATLEPEVSKENVVVDNKHVDIKEYMANNNDKEELEAKTTNFATIRQELEGQLAELDALRSDMNFDGEISFNDLEPESYGMGKAA